MHAPALHEHARVRSAHAHWRSGWKFELSINRTRNRILGKTVADIYVRMFFMHELLSGWMLPREDEMVSS